MVHVRKKVRHIFKFLKINVFPRISISAKAVSTAEAVKSIINVVLGKRYFIYFSDVYISNSVFVNLKMEVFILI